MTVATAGSAPPPLSTSPVKPDRPEGISTARTGARPRLRRRIGPFQAGPVGGVDHQIRGWQRRTPAQVGRFEHVDLGSVAGQQFGRQPTVSAVIALAGHDRYLLAVGAVEQAGGAASHSRTGPADEDVHRLLRLPVYAGHLRRGQDGDHASATTTAAAVLDVCVKETIHERTWRSEASRAASPESTR